MKYGRRRITEDFHIDNSDCVIPGFNEDAHTNLEGVGKSQFTSTGDEAMLVSEASVSEDSTCERHASLPRVIAYKTMGFTMYFRVARTSGRATKYGKALNTGGMVSMRRSKG